MNTRGLLRKITDAIGAKRLSNALRKFGLRCTAEFVYSQGYEQLTLRRNFLETLLIWLEAIASVDWASFEVIWNELELFKRELWQKYGTKFPNQNNDVIKELLTMRNKLDLILQG